MSADTPIREPDEIRRDCFVPVPAPLVPVFKITEGAREFFVRFDVLTN
jgi:hypothetical protein